MKAQLAMASLLSLAACSERATSTDPTKRTKPLVCTTLYPIHYLAMRLAGEFAQIECVIPANADPLHWRPDTAAIQRMQGADLILFNGAAAEQWAFSLSLPMSRLVETARGFKDRFITHEGVTHSHGGGSSHTHAGSDPHTWMDPKNAIAQARATAIALERLLPDHTTAIREHLSALESDLNGLDAALVALGPQPDGEVILASHAAYDYLAQRYGWRLENFDFDPQSPPIPEQIAWVRQTLGTRRARTILWERTPAPEWTSALAKETGAQPLLFAPCETLPGKGAPDYLAAMRANIERLATVWK